MAIFERIPVGDLFGKTPYMPLHKHIEKVNECADELRPLVEAFIAEDYDRVEELANKISNLEHEADKVKTDIRIHLPRRLFMQVDRGDILSFLKKQDTIADKVEDAAHLIQIRRTKVPEEIRDDLLEFVDSVKSAVDALEVAYSELNRLLETSFGRKEHDKMLKLINKVDHHEWKADELQLKMSKKLFEIEEKLDPLSIWFLIRIINEIDAVADYAEDSGDQLRTMIAK
ncbi:MAG: TIGR00153 family protein [Candidatus Altiarchaeales archaeon WOR_SM1_86-2]|nr:MAG: TIGR00153 family protein [Candidatus Altiarchaeales archaeon WOR_SM1_79]ODS37970.1 MAG: TIGR00153 family protein [Candidatus Altiarchaeales archaeon WOR_SM1_86-2]